MNAERRNKRGEATRRALLDAGWHLIDRMTLQELLVSVTARAVTREGGVTTGAFFHHFANHGEFVDAMVRQLVASRPAGAPHDAAETTDIREAARSYIAAARSDEAQLYERLSALLFAAVGTTTVGGEPLAEVLRPLFDGGRAAVAEQLRRTGMFQRWRERSALDPEQAALAFWAMRGGLQIHHRVQPELVDEEFLAVAWVAFLVALARPAPALLSLDDASIDALTRPRRGITVLGVGVGPDELTALATLFNDGWEHRTFHDAEPILGRPAAELAAGFRTVRRLAAASFAASLASIEEAAVRYSESDPWRALADVLCEIARAASAYRIPGAALLAERFLVRRTAYEGAALDDLRFVVPIVPAVMTPAALVARPGVDWSTLVRAAGDVVDVMLQLGISRPRNPPAVLAELGLTLMEDAVRPVP